MTTRNKNKKVFRSIEEFEKQYFPKSLSERLSEGHTDPKSFGSEQAAKVLEQIKSSLGDVKLRK